MSAEFEAQKIEAGRKVLEQLREDYRAESYFLFALRSTGYDVQFVLPGRVANSVPDPIASAYLWEAFQFLTRQIIEQAIACAQRDMRAIAESAIAEHEAQIVKLRALLKEPHATP